MKLVFLTCIYLVSVFPDLIRWSIWVVCAQNYISILYAFKIVNDFIHESESHSVVSHSLRPHGLHSSWNPPGHNPGVGSLSYCDFIIFEQYVLPILSIHVS